MLLTASETREAVELAPAPSCRARSILIDVAPYQVAITIMMPAAIFAAYPIHFELFGFASGIVKTSAMDDFGGSGFWGTRSGFSQTVRRLNRGGAGVNRTFLGSSLHSTLPRTCCAWNSSATIPGFGMLGMGRCCCGCGVFTATVPIGTTSSLRGAAGGLPAGGA